MLIMKMKVTQSQPIKTYLKNFVLIHDAYVYEG